MSPVPLRGDGRYRKIGDDRMSVERPVWFGYIEWDYSDPSFPVMKGLREDTPPEIRKRFEEDQKAYEEAYENGILI